MGSVGRLVQDSLGTVQHSSKQHALMDMKYWSACDIPPLPRPVYSSAPTIRQFNDYPCKLLPQVTTNKLRSRDVFVGKIKTRAHTNIRTPKKKNKDL